MAGRHQVYPSYGESGVEWLGKLPAHWETKRLGHFFEERRQKVSDKDYSALSVTKQGIVPQLENAAKTDAGDNRKLVLKNDFVINSRSDRKGSSGVSIFDGSVSLISIVMIPRNITPRFVHHLLRSYPFQEEFYRYGKGIVADLWSTNSSEMKNILLPDIPIQEQQKIADFLDHETAKIDTLIEKQQQLIKLLKEKRQAVISHAVTKGLNPNAPMRDSGVEWLGEVPELWVSCALKYGSQIVDCKHITAEFFDEGIPLASIGEVKGWHVDLASAKLTNKRYYCDLIGGGRKPESGDIIYSRNATVGEAALVVEGMPDFAMGQDVCLIRLNENISSEYILYVLKSGVISNQLDLAMVGSTFKRINVDDIRNFAVALPSYEGQLEIVEELTRILSKYDTLVVNAEKAISLMAERRTALISAAVTGKIDVRNWVAPESSITINKDVAA
ncbi:restriction endonuclease subunit S [Porticoccaceae bacterium]|nr:restriction endonuclease subunit S [Porticoccaceae bacterium]